MHAYLHDMIQISPAFCDDACEQFHQLWSVYCESLASMNAPYSEAYNNAHQMVMDFWGRVTPGVLQLLSHSKAVNDYTAVIQSCHQSINQSFNHFLLTKYTGK